MWRKTVVIKWLADQGITQAALARRANISEAHFSRIMRGDNKKDPTTHTLQRLENAMALERGTLGGGIKKCS